MQQNQVMLLVVLLIVIVVIVAAVLLMGGGGGEQTIPMTGPGTAPGGGGAPGGSPSGPPSGGGTPSIGSDVLNAISAGMPVVCTMSDPSDGGMAINLKMELPKVRMEGAVVGVSFTIISDGTNAYMQNSMQGSDWYIYPLDMVDVKIATPDEIGGCQVSGDIPDSEFQLPPGVVPKDLSAMAGDFDPSMYEDMF